MNIVTTNYYRIRAVLVKWVLRLLPRNTPLVFQGADASINLCRQISRLGYERVLVVTDEFLATSGVLDGIEATLSETKVTYRVFSDILPDPDFTQVQAGEVALREHRGAAIVAVGGGSVLDAAKMIALLHTNPAPLKHFDGIARAKHRPLPVFAIPTTAGTGSEITLAAVISEPVSHKKIPIIDGKMIPDYIALDANLMLGLPPAITAATGMDALTHAVESYLSKASHPSSEAQATAAISLIFEYLLKAYHNGGDWQARDAMATASFYAGAAFSKTAVGYVHAIAHQFGRLCKTPHGNANAMVLPEVLRAYGVCVESRLAALARLVGLDEDDSGTQNDETLLAERFISAIESMRSEMQLPLQPEGLGLHQISDVVSEAQIEAGMTYPVPRYFSDAEIASIVRRLIQT